MHQELKSGTNMKVIALIRVSTKAQELESQSLKVREQILRDGYSPEDIIFIEDKESGSKLSEEERSGLNKLKSIIDSKQVSSVYVYEISRISRRPAVIYSIRDLLISKKIQLIILNPPVRLLKEDGSIDESSNMFFGLFSSLSENETYLRTARIMRGKEKKKNEGKLSCGKPLFGYTLTKDKHPIPDPKNSLIIKEIFERYISLESSGSIGKDLYLRGAIPTRSLKAVSIQSYISVILRERRYAGLSPDSVYPPIISKEIFTRAQEILSSKPDHFVRKSNTHYTYPLQGYIYTEDGYKLIPSISNNRYLKARGVGTSTPLSLNMKAVHTLSRYIFNKYLQSGVHLQERESQIQELELELEHNKESLSTIDTKISALQKENDFINTRIIKGRISETKGDGMIDKNILEIHSLEDKRASLEYSNYLIINKLNYLANPLLNSDQIITLNTLTDLKTLVHKYLARVDVKKNSFSNYTLYYTFLDGTVLCGSFYSIHSGQRFWDGEGNEINVEPFPGDGKKEG